MDTIKAFFTYAYAFAVLGVAVYGLVITEYALDDLSKGALIAWGGQAIQFVFSQETAKATAAASQKAYDRGLATPTAMTTTTTVAGDPPTTTTTGPAAKENTTEVVPEDSGTP